MSRALSSPELTAALKQLVFDYGRGVTAEGRIQSLLNDALRENARAHVLQLNLLATAALSGISASILTLDSDSDHQLTVLAQRMVTEQGISLEHALWTVRTLWGVGNPVRHQALGLATEMAAEKAPPQVPQLAPNRYILSTKDLSARSRVPTRLVATLCVLLAVLGAALVRAFGADAPAGSSSESSIRTDENGFGFDSPSPVPSPLPSPSATFADTVTTTLPPVRGASPSPFRSSPAKSPSPSPSPLTTAVTVPTSVVPTQVPSSVAPIVDPSRSPTSGSQSFRAVGVSSFTVPACVNEIRVTLVSGRGGKGGFNTPAGGTGSEILGLMPVVTGETLSIFVAENGLSADSGGRGGQGYGNGGNGGMGSLSGGGGGGGASAIVRSGAPQIVVGGGGGSGASTDNNETDGGMTGVEGFRGGKGAAPDGKSSGGRNGGAGGTQDVAGGGGGGGGFVGGGGGSSGPGFGGGGGPGSGYQSDDVAITRNSSTVKAPIVTVSWTGEC